MTEQELQRYKIEIVAENFARKKETNISIWERFSSYSDDEFYWWSYGKAYLVFYAAWDDYLHGRPVFIGPLVHSVLHGSKQYSAISAAVNERMPDFYIADYISDDYWLREISQVFDREISASTLLDRSYLEKLSRDLMHSQKEESMA